MLNKVEVYAGDPILSLLDMYRRDERAAKVNLSIGFYYDQNGNIPILESVTAAKTHLDTLPAVPNLYLPMEGTADYRTAVEHHLFGEHHPAVQSSRVATIQAVGGSGAIKVGADFLKRYFPDSGVWVSDPTWDNHNAIFLGAGFEVHKYPYYSCATGELDFDRMMSTLAHLPTQSIVLMHACCHNPTGVDLTNEQWDAFISLASSKQLIPFLDAAYIGFGDGVEEDTYSIRAMAASGITFFLSNSFSKVFSLYGERVGSLSVCCTDAEEAERVLGQLKSTVRTNYSNPPKQGALLVSQVLNDVQLKSLWECEVEQMRERVQSMREALHDALQELCPEYDAGYLLRQKGMFSFTGLTPEQVDRMREEHGVYLIKSGRMCVAGLSDANVPAVAKAIAAVQAAG
ncbi:aspartate/tyrosine/aromatic aminotransferase [Pseudomonas silvicola]|nr:aspartate/tyrosine/aromatic aminotransferase [Pseudomonas silvicola]